MTGTANRHPGWGTLAVRDTGRGIDRAMLPRIFSFFERDAEAQRRGVGRGLGLPVSKAIVESPQDVERSAAAGFARHIVLAAIRALGEP